MILSRPTDERFHCLFDAFRQGFTLEEIAHLTAITPFFLEKIKNIVDLEKRLAAGSSDEDILLAKTYGFTNTEIAALTGKDTDCDRRTGGRCRSTRWWTPVLRSFRQAPPISTRHGKRTSEIVPDNRDRKYSFSAPARSGSARE